MRIYSVKLGVFFLFNSLLGMAQTGKVGINTEAPTETFDVKGTMRVRDLPKDRVGKLYNGKEEKAKGDEDIFIATRSVVADNDGNLGFRPFSGVYAKMRKISDNTPRKDRAVKDDDYTLFVSTSALALPDPTQNKDRMLIVCVEGVSNGGQRSTLTITSKGRIGRPANIILPTLSPSNTEIILTNGGGQGSRGDVSCMKFHSDGKNWHGILTYTH